jgi:acetyltransferase-like isoleucine patch superfamily enzyme
MNLYRFILKAMIRLVRRIKMVLFRPLFKKYGRNFKFDANSSFSYQTIEVGDDVFIGSGANFSATESKIIIGSKVMFGPNVTIMGGDHNISKIGKYMFDVKEKLPENDAPVIIEDDVWIGTGVIILKGVKIGTGSVVAAGALVINDVPAYSVVAGVPAKVLKQRFSLEELMEHKNILSKSK